MLAEAFFAAFLCAGSICIPRDPASDDLEIVRVVSARFTRPIKPNGRRGGRKVQIPAVNLDEYPPDTWMTIDLGLPDDVVAVCMRSRIAISNALKSKRGEGIGLQFYQPGSVDESRDPSIKEHFVAKGRVTDFEGSGVRSDSSWCVALEDGMVGFRWTASGFNPRRNGVTWNIAVWITSMVIDDGR